MRQLITNDVFKMSRILKKLELDFEQTDTDEELVLDLIKKVAENAYMAQNEINAFLGELSGMTGEEFGNLPIKESIAIIKEVRQLEGIMDFFKLAGQ